MAAGETLVLRWRSHADAIEKGLIELADQIAPAMQADGSETKSLGALLLARSLSNLRGSLILIDAGRLVEAKVIVRCCQENMF